MAGGLCAQQHPPLLHQRNEVGGEGDSRLRRAEGGRRAAMERVDGETAVGEYRHYIYKRRPGRYGRGISALAFRFLYAASEQCHKASWLSTAFLLGSEPDVQPR